MMVPVIWILRDCTLIPRSRITPPFHRSITRKITFFKLSCLTSFIISLIILKELISYSRQRFFQKNYCPSCKITVFHWIRNISASLIRIQGKNINLKLQQKNRTVQKKRLLKMSLSLNGSSSCCRKISEQKTRILIRKFFFLSKKTVNLR